MTEGPEWQPIIDAVSKEPSSKPKKRLTEQDLQDRNREINRRNAANLAVAHGAVDTGDDFDPWDWFSGWSNGITTQLTENTEAIANLSDIAAATNTTVAYVGDLEDMVSFPRSDLQILGGLSPKYLDFLDGFTFSCADASHNHGWYMSACPTIVPPKTLGSSIGDVYYTPIIVDRNGTVDKLRWVVGPDDGLVSINYYEMALCVYNPSTLNVEKVWGSGNIKDGDSDTTTMKEVAISMGISQACTPGQLLFVAHQQVAPGALQSPRRYAAKPQAGIARPGLLLDAASYVAQDYSQGIPSSISFASLTRENRFIPWAAVSVNA